MPVPGATVSTLSLVFERNAHGSTIHGYGDGPSRAIVTVTTVGYGDKYPVTSARRGVAVVLMLVGIGLIGVLTATVASFFVEEEADQQTGELSQRLERIEATLAALNAHLHQSNGTVPHPVTQDVAHQPAPEKTSES